jgi:hypothetical protein
LGFNGSQDSGFIRKECDKIERSINSAKDPLGACKEFINSFLQELNARNQTSLSISDACELLKANLHTLQFTQEQKELLVLAIQLMDSRTEIPTSLHINFYWPWEWNWFGLNKHKSGRSHGRSLALSANDMTRELPSNCYFGACELFAAALLAIIPSTLTWSAAGVLATDGCRRIAEGVIQLSDERRNDPNYVPPRIDYGQGLEDN